ncbi:hypothetical protein EU527_02555 [Candidatus Thorarchaeota archaeon]|nr:MAG: hypothetical protein EU527_02555 [Candidatus Thorarchaeota archaeon]
MTFPIVIYLCNEVHRGKISYTTEGPKITIDGINDLKLSKQDIEFRFIEDSKSEENVCIIENRIRFSPISCLKKYSIDVQSQDDLYPPSSKRWVKHLSELGSEALFSVQEIIGEKHYLMSVVDVLSGNLLRLHPIHNYEAAILLMETDWENYNRLLVRETISLNDTKIIEKLLDGSPPSWAELSQLVQGINVPNLKRGSAMRETMNQLIPKSYPKEIRIELMAFLAYTINLKIPKVDPLDFQAAMRKQFQSMPLLHTLLIGHIQCLLEGIEPPQYVRLMIMGERKLIQDGKEPTPSNSDLWTSTWYKLMSMFPDQKKRVAVIAARLNKNQDVITELPITRYDAKKSRDAWLNRFSLVRDGIMLRGYVQDQKIGLTKMVYIGNTHRWPHKHLALSARLGNPEKNAPFIQMMVMPLTASERIMRSKPNIAQVDWSTSTVNYHLYDVKNRRWKTNLTQLTKSISSSKKTNELNREFNINTESFVRIPDMIEAKVLDFASLGMYLQSLELGNYYELLHLNSRGLKKKLGELIDAGIIQLQYLSYFSGLISFCIEIRGDLAQLNAIAGSSLRYFPSATVMISNDKQICYILCRIPEELALELFAKLPARAEEHNLIFKGYRMTAYVGYVHNLYQRLLQPDGTWDDDISGFLSQIRT